MIRSLINQFRQKAADRKRESLTIFAYHGVSASPLPFPDPCFMTLDTFSRQLDTIIDSYHLLPLREGLHQLQKGEIREPCAALTFDDGFADLHKVVFPVIKKKKAPITLFPVADLIDSEETVWFCWLIDAIIQTDKKFLEWNDRRLDLSSPDDRTSASVFLQEELKYQAPAQFRSSLLKIETDLGVEKRFPLPVDSPFRILDRTSIGEMAASGLVEFGSHGTSHTILSLLNRDEQQRELAGSIDTIREMSGQTVDLFAYPNGRQTDYNEETIDLLRQFGMYAALTMRQGRAVGRSPLMELPRFWVDENTPLEEIACR